MLFEKEKVKLTEKQEVTLSTISNQQLVSNDSTASVKAASKFEVLELIGEGGYGLVYKVRCIDSNKIHALKLLKIDLESDKTALKRFQLEAKNLAKVSHNNLVGIDDQGFLEDGTPYILMEYFESVSLAQLIADSKLDFKLCLKIFIQVCAGVEAIHNKGIIHRDLTPNNILIQRNKKSPKVKLVDFGIAKSLPSASATTQGFTETGKVFGTPDYMSPEQCMSQKLSKSSDIYSIGCCLYEALMGSPPFKGKNAIETMLMHTELKPEELDKSVPSSKITNRIVQKTLEKKPKDRFSSAKRLKKELLKLEAGSIRFGPLYPNEKIITLFTAAFLALCLFIPQLNLTRPKNDSGSALKAISARPLFEALPELTNASPFLVDQRINYIVGKTREAGKKVEYPWSRKLIDSWTNMSNSDKGVQVTKNHGEAKLTLKQAIAEAVKIGSPAIPYVSQFLNDDVRLVRNFCEKTIKEEVPFPTKTLVQAMVKNKGVYYDSSIKLMSYGGAESVAAFSDVLRSGTVKERERAISLIALTMMSANRNMEISNKTRDNLINALNDTALKNRYLLPSILIVLRSEDPIVKQKIDNLLINDKSIKTRMACASALGYYLNQPFIKGRENTLNLLNQSVKNDQSLAVRLSSISNLLADYNQDSKVRGYLESYLNTSDLQIRYAARTSLKLLDLKMTPTKELSAEERNEIFFAIRENKPLSPTMISNIVLSSEHRLSNINLSKDSVIGVELPLMIYRLTKTNDSFHIYSTKKEKYIGLQTWMINAGYSIRRTSSRASFARSLDLAGTVQYKNYFAGRTY